jgi:hypothetical protein
MELSRMAYTVTYAAAHDAVGHYVPAANKRRFVVLRLINGRLAWCCGAFASMGAAEKRAADLNLSADKE